MAVVGCIKHEQKTLKKKKAIYDITERKNNGMIMKRNVRCDPSTTDRVREDIKN